MKKETENISESEMEKRLWELERLAEELKKSRDAAVAEVKKYSAFYESASAGYFTVKPDGTICDLNLSGARLLGRDSSGLINTRFRLYVTPDTRAVFDEFLQRVFISGTRQSCEVRVKNENDISAFIQLDGIVPDNSRICFLTAEDITDRRLAEEIVYSLLGEKDIILKEVHHRVKNNMYNIGALLNMQANAQENPAAKSVLFDAAGRVQSMSVLYDKLYRSEHPGAVSLREYLPDLVHEIVDIFPHKKSVKVRTRVDSIILDAKILSILGILVNELITNSMKYAFTGRENGLITVDVSKKDEHITIITADNGNGIPEDITFENTTGFGMQLVAMLTEQLGGSIRIERGDGTRFVLEFEV